MESIQVMNAREIARAFHYGQVRKYTGEPYVNHCEEVAGILEEIGCIEEVISAGWLHDTIEDTSMSAELLKMLIGKSVTELVVEVTHIAKKTDGNRAKRKAIDREFLSKASPEGQTIKLADIISNTRSIVERDPKFAETYIPECRALLNILQKGNLSLWTRASDILHIEDLRACPK